MRSNFQKKLLRVTWMAPLWLARYVSILVELTRMEGTRHGKMIASQMLDVAVRVQAIRHFAVAQMVSKHTLLPYVENGYFTIFRMLDVDIPGKRRRGRPNLRWKDACKRDMREAWLKEDNTTNRAAWRKKLISYTGDPIWRWNPWRNGLEENCVCLSDPTINWEWIEMDEELKINFVPRPHILSQYSQHLSTTVSCGSQYPKERLSFAWLKPLSYILIGLYKHSLIGACLCAQLVVPCSPWLTINNGIAICCGEKFELRYIFPFESHDFWFILPTSNCLHA